MLNLFNRNKNAQQTVTDEQGRRAVIDIREITKMYKMGELRFTRYGV